MKISIENYTELTEKYLLNNLSLVDLLETGVQEKHGSFIGDSEYYINLVKDEVVDEKQIIDFLRDQPYLTRILENNQFLMQLENSGRFSKDILDQLQITHDIQNEFVQVFDDGSVDLDEISKKYSKPRHEILEIFGRASTNDMYSYYKYGGGHSLISDMSDYDPSGMRSSSAVNILESWLYNAFHSKDFDFARDLIVSFKHQFKNDNTENRYDASENALVSFVSRNILEASDTNIDLVQVLFDLNDRELLKTLLDSVNIHRADSLREITNVRKFLDEICLILSIAEKHEQETTEQKVAVYQKLEQQTELQEQYVEPVKNKYLNSVCQKLESPKFFFQLLNEASPYFQILDENNIFSLHQSFELALKNLKKGGEREDMKNDDLLLQSFHNLVGQNRLNSLIDSLREKHQFKPEYAQSLVDTMLVNDNFTRCCNDVSELLQDLYEKNEIQDEQMLKIIQQLKQQRVHELLRDHILLKFADKYNMFESNNEFINAVAQNNIYTFFQNNVIRNKIMNDFSDQDLRHMFDIICQNKEVFYGAFIERSQKDIFQHMYDRQIFTQPEFEKIFTESFDAYLQSSASNKSKKFYMLGSEVVLSNKLLSDQTFKKYFDEIDSFDEICGLFRFYATQLLKYALDNFLLDASLIRRSEQIIKGSNWVQFEMDDLFDFIINENQRNEPIVEAAKFYKDAWICMTLYDINSQEFSEFLTTIQNDSKIRDKAKFFANLDLENRFTKEQLREIFDLILYKSEGSQTTLQKIVENNLLSQYDFESLKNVLSKDVDKKKYKMNF